MSYFPNKAVENTILNLLAASETNFEFPSLQNEAVDLISDKLADIVYTSLKPNSTIGSTKRGNILKFINNICSTPEFHLGKDHYKIYLKAFEEEFCQTECPEVVCLSSTISKEVSDIPNDTYSSVVQFYKRKNLKKRENVKKLELIKKYDQEKLSENMDLHISRNMSLYETSEHLIKDLLKEDKEPNTKPVFSRQNSREYREKQVQFCYALINLDEDRSHKRVLETVLHKLSTYNILEKFEVKCLTDLWLLGDDRGLDCTKIICEKFPFVIEKQIIKFCTEIIKLKDSSEVSEYFSALPMNPVIKRLQYTFAKDLGFYLKLKSLIHELYVFSYCNANVYRFTDYII